MQINPVIQKLFHYGHLNNKENPTGITEADLPNLKLTDKAVKAGLQSYVHLMGADFDRLSVEIHGRLGIADGEFGPATEALLNMERCGYPDYTVEAANGSGSWPANCRADHPGIHTFSVQMNKSGMPSYLQDVIEPAWLLVRQAYANMGILFLREDDNPKANTYVTWTRGAGWIGLAIVPRSPRCGERIWAKFDNRYRPSQLLDQWARLIAHELGHNMGMSHSRGGIMNPSITSGKFTPTAWRGDPSEGILRRFFGGVPVPIDGPPPEEEPPTPPTDPSGLWFAGGFKAMLGETPMGEFILVPKPKV